MENNHRVISMVPSWTETLLACGVNVVGRTRFCIHPQDSVKAIPVVGGTKDIDWAKINALKPTLIILDKDENPKKFAEDSKTPYIASHIRSVQDVHVDLFKFSEILDNKELKDLALRWEKIAQTQNSKKTFGDIPGIMNWINPVDSSTEKFIYMIWKKPWMAASRQTFIGSCFEKLGLGWAMANFEEPYPKIDLGGFDPAKTLILFSSEPYPFGKKISEIQSALETKNFASAIIDGESFSWFGVRSLKFLESALSGGSDKLSL